MQRTICNRDFIPPGIMRLTRITVEIQQLIGNLSVAPGTEVNTIVEQRAVHPR
jgi:hypothetical protein